MPAACQDQNAARILLTGAAEFARLSADAVSMFAGDLRITKIIPLLGGARGGADAVESRHAAHPPPAPPKRGRRGRASLRQQTFEVLKTSNVLIPQKT